MSFLELFLLALGLSMDACAVSICKGLALRQVRLRHMLIVGAWFGVFQAGMPLLGYLLGSRFEQYIASFDHWIAFALLAAIGANMLREAFCKEEEAPDAALGFKPMLLMAIATSIDALAVGVTFAFLAVRIIPAVALIGFTTLLLSAAGVRLGSVFGAKYQRRAEMLGGCVLILLGLKILLEHLGVLPF